MRTIKKLSPWYVTGYVDGEGSFTYSRSGANLFVIFAIRLTGSDRGLLESIRHFFGGAGRLYAASRRGSTRAGRYYRITRPVELRRVVEHFDRYPLRGEKQRAYRVWRKMVLVKAAHLGKRTPAQLLSLAEELSLSTPRGRRTPGSREPFCAISPI